MAVGQVFNAIVVSGLASDALWSPQSREASFDGATLALGKNW